ncbi:MAG: T9SS type A sorting domain-containing protein [Ignavibacteriae bacterium]|nr:T9SS C-terminal target domain-containing protein [Ignavibacteriota bacterium]NOG99515.1 T9SS type A sorting domain-containing protein [Ignavibacteriota bacterium]
MRSILKIFLLSRIDALLFCLAAFSFVSILKAQTANVYIQPVEQNINADSSIFVTVSISNVSDLHSYSITLPYEGSLVEITDVNELDFFAAHSILFFPKINSAQNSLLVDAAILGPNTQTGSGDFFEVEFKAKAAGVVHLNLQNIILRDSQNNDIPFTTSGGIIRINPVTDVSEIYNERASINTISNYPNPFNNSTVIIYNANYNEQIELKIFSLLGDLVFSKQAMGIPNVENKFNWNGKNNLGVELPSGIYLVTIFEKDIFASKKITLLK